VTVFLEPEHLLETADVAAGPGVVVRDSGLLTAAAGRPAASFAGKEAYPRLEDKVAALLHSLVGNHALVDGNKRLAWLATYVFLDLNGVVLEAPDDDAFDLVMLLLPASRRAADRRGAPLLVPYPPVTAGQRDHPAALPLLERWAVRPGRPAPAGRGRRAVAAAPR
jgi:death-on-curing protein